VTDRTSVSWPAFRGFYPVIGPVVRTAPSRRIRILGEDFAAQAFQPANDSRDFSSLVETAFRGVGNMRGGL
jgi:hypothetical protein